MKEIIINNFRWSVQTRADTEGNTHKLIAIEVIPDQEVLMLPLTNEMARDLASKLTSGIVMPTSVPGEADALKSVTMRPPPAKGGANSRMGG